MNAVSDRQIGGAHHVPDPQDDGSCADMVAQAAACGVPAVPRGDHHLVCEHLDTGSAFALREKERPCCPIDVRCASTVTEK